MDHIRSKLGWGVAAALGLLLLAALAGAVNSGQLEPPGPPGPTDATTIDSLPYTIDKPGAYRLKGNLTGVAGSHGIVVNADNVTIDLNGFGLVGPGTPQNRETGIITGATKNFTVHNGSISGWSCGGVDASANVGAHFYDLNVSGSGTRDCTDGDAGLSLYTGTVTRVIVVGGFFGIVATDAVISDCSVRDNTETGITVVGGAVRDCDVSGNDGGGVFTNGATIRDSVVKGNSFVGIFGSGLITGNQVQENGWAGEAAGILIEDDSTVTRNIVISSGGDGIEVVGDWNYVAENNVSGSGRAGGAHAGVWLKQSANNNRIDGNNLSRGLYGVVAQGNDNLIVRNSATSMYLQYLIEGSGNIAGVEEGANTNPITPLTNPWANIWY